MYNLSTIVQRKTITLTPDAPQQSLAFESLINVRFVYALGFNRYVGANSDARVYDFAPLVSLRINDKDRLKDIPSSLHEICFGEKFLLPLDLDTSTNPARFDLSVKYHELFPQSPAVSGGHTEKPAQPLCDITLELLIFGVSK